MLHFKIGSESYNLYNFFNLFTPTPPQQDQLCFLSTPETCIELTTETPKNGCYWFEIGCLPFRVNQTVGDPLSYYVGIPKGFLEEKVRRFSIIFEWASTILEGLDVDYISRVGLLTLLDESYVDIESVEKTSSGGLWGKPSYQKIYYARVLLKKDVLFSSLEFGSSDIREFQWVCDKPSGKMESGIFNVDTKAINNRMRRSLLKAKRKK